ncbi:MAG: tetratricopeptide repeat protein [Myxococcales bacterium]|nr:tetratricopeptide repeat protein [Myxococcales bacterium]
MRLLLAAVLLAAPADDTARAKQLYEQGQTEFELGHYPDAIAKWEEAYRLKPVPQALYNMGQAYYKMGRLEEAAHAYKTMIAKLKNGKNVDLARQRLIQVEDELKKGGPAGPAQKESQLVTVAVAPFRTEGLDPSMQWLGKSFADALLNRLQKARSVRVVEREFLDQVLAEMKLQSSSLIDEKSAVAVGRILGAKVIVFGSVAVLGDDALARARIVGVERAELLGSGEAQGAVKQLFAIQADLGKQVAQSMSISAALGESGLDVTEMTLAAYGDLDRARELARGVPFLGLDPARRRRSGDYQLGISLCDKLLAAYPKLAPARIYRGIFSLETEDLERAEHEVAFALKLAPDSIEAWQLQANVKFVRGDLGEAARLFKNVAEKFPDDARGWYALGRVQMQQGNKPGAAASLVAALSRAPFLPEAETALRTLVAGPDSAATMETLRTQDPAAHAAALAYQGFFRGQAVPAELAAQVVHDSPRLYLGYYMEALSPGVETGKREDLLRTSLSLRSSFPEAHRDLGKLLLAQRRCSEGDQHVDLYMRTASAVDDFGPLKEQMQQCRGG